MDRSYYGHQSFLLKPFYHLHRAVVLRVAACKCLSEFRISPVYELWHRQLFFILPVSLVPGQDHDHPFISLALGIFHRYGIRDAAVEHGHTVDIGDLCDVRKTAWCAHDVHNPFAVSLFLEIFGLAGQAVGGHHDEPVRIRKVCLVIIRDYLFGEVLEEKLVVHYATLREQVLESYIMVLVHQVYVAGLGPAPLSGHVWQSVACSGADSYGEREADSLVHEAVKHTASEYSSKSSTFQYQCCVVADSHPFNFIRMQKYE